MQCSVQKCRLSLICLFQFSLNKTAEKNVLIGQLKLLFFNDYLHNYAEQKKKLVNGYFLLLSQIIIMLGTFAVTHSTTTGLNKTGWKMKENSSGKSMK